MADADSSHTDELEPASEASHATSEAADDADKPTAVQSALQPCFSSGPNPDMGPFLSKRFVRCINGEGRWLLSGAKPGNGIECLLDDSLETWWQSDGKTPHIAQVTFPTRTTVVGVAVYVLYSTDESYTPSKISIMAGSCRDSTVRVASVQLEEPEGWVYLPLALQDTDADLTVPKSRRADPASRVGSVVARGEVCCLPWTLKPVRCNVLQLQVPAMHQNGRDTRVRQVRIYGPAISRSLAMPPSAHARPSGTIPAALAALQADPALAERVAAAAEASAAGAAEQAAARLVPQLHPGAVALSSMRVR